MAEYAAEESERLGFAWLARLVDTEDADVLWIVGENLNRLVRHFPERVAAIQVRL